MDQKKLIERAKRRRQMVHVASETRDSLVAEIGTAWLRETMQKWNPEENKNVPSGVSVGSDFERWIDKYLKNSNFRARELDGFAKLVAKQVAHWIDVNDTSVTGHNFPNPISDVEKAKSDGYKVVSLPFSTQQQELPLAASTNKKSKIAESVYGPVSQDDRYRNMYAAPDEHPRTCPDHPGALLKRVSDGVYQCMLDGDHYSAEGGHEVTFESGVHNQTNIGWNDTFPQPGFLSKSQQSWENKDLVEYGKDKKIKKEEPKEGSLKGLAKSAKDKIPGGLADDKSPEDFDPGAIEKGVEVELEHTTDKQIAEEIAMDHLTEDSEYYEKLEVMESHANLKREALDISETKCKSCLGPAARGGGATRCTNPSCPEYHPDAERVLMQKDRREQKGQPGLIQKILKKLMSSRGRVKQAEFEVEVDDHVFGPVQVQTRYCPDHDAVNLYRIADKVYQCPLDRKVYNFEQGFRTEDGVDNFGGSVANMTPDRPGYYNSGNAFFVAQKGIKGLTKQAEDKPVSLVRQFKERTHQWLSENIPLEQAKAEYLDFAHQIFGSKRYDITETVVSGNPKNPNDNGISNLTKLVEYIWNSLLKFEGEGVLRTSLKGVSKEAFSTNVDNRFAFDLSHALAGDASSRRLLELVVEGVIKAGKDLRQAIRDAYIVVENSASENVINTEPAQPVAPEIEAPTGEMPLAASDQREIKTAQEALDIRPLVEKIYRLRDEKKMDIGPYEKYLKIAEKSQDAALYEKLMDTVDLRLGQVIPE